MKIRNFLAAVLCMAATAASSTPVELQAGKSVVRLEFFTPEIVHVVKSPVGHEYEKQSLVVIAKPENVKVNHKGNTLSSNVLSVTMDSNTGALTFSAKGKTLLREKDACSFEPRTEGPDAGAYRVTQTFVLDADEAIYEMIDGSYQLLGKYTITFVKVD